MKNGASRAPIVKKLKAPATIYDKDFLNGFAVELTEADLSEIRTHADVEAIEENGIMSITETVTQTDATWNLQCISQSCRVMGSSTSTNFTYHYNATGAGVDVYVVDTGILITHTEFGGQARWGVTFGGYANVDGNGHGTHCAGIVGGSRFGVAKEVSLIAVKVLSDGGSGTVSDIISSLNWVLTQARFSGRPSIVSLSLGGGATTTLDNAVATLTSDVASRHRRCWQQWCQRFWFQSSLGAFVTYGHHALIGGDRKGAARALSALTVGASDIYNQFAYFSNYGPGVDILAPGVNIISAYSTSNTATASLSGTSMAAPPPRCWAPRLSNLRKSEPR